MLTGSKELSGGFFKTSADFINRTILCLTQEYFYHELLLLLMSKVEGDPTIGSINCDNVTNDKGHRQWGKDGIDKVKIKFNY